MRLVGLKMAAHHVDRASGWRAGHSEKTAVCSRRHFLLMIGSAILVADPRLIARTQMP